MRDASAKSACFVLILCTPFLLTYLFTYIRFLWQTRPCSRAEAIRPAIPSYFVPGLGHAYSILFNAERFLRPLQPRLKGSVLSLSAPASSLCYVLPGEGVRSLFKGPRELVPVPGIFDALTIFFGLQAADYHVFEHNYVSAFEKRDGAGFSTSHPDASRRIMEHQRKDFITFLNGENLRLVMDRFSSNLNHQLWPHNASVTNQCPVVFPDLYKFVRDAIFRAEVEALYGKHIFKSCPSFCEDFWALYDAFPVISRGGPRWMYPSQYRTRDLVLENLSKWRSWCNSNSDHDDTEPGNAEYDPIWGTRYVRNMVRRYEDLGFSEAGISSVILGFLFVTTANTIPAACWMVLHALLDQSLTLRLRHELSIRDNGEKTSLDCTVLSSAPLLNSVYRETLRLHVAGAIGRKSVGGGLRLHGDSFSTLPSGTTALSANWLGGLDGSIWNTGRKTNGVTEHSLESFWAERFLEYPDDPTSGPLRKPDSVTHNYDVTEKYVRDDSKAKLSNPSALRGHFFPFGGGAWRCPGETLAKNTILVSVFLILRDFQVEILDPTDAAQARSHHRAMPFGSHAFDRKVPVKICKRG
ncbi:cytochrome P450 [Colletotrichum godetiae]|uniref:Cytochrome P450 n=1 Tax=Colletotrichum godetiae TaxID=1209918 RepID=A0AAJ0AHN7_9PEZI|nr:cytochrome P450 [Colletotrichum godetiae]KAK1674074.1 cytochrome P450 [Colletotrichum godetiae]